VPPSGQISTAVQGDAKILYDFGGENWAGIGTDTGGNVWLRTGTGSDIFLLWDRAEQSASHNFPRIQTGHSQGNQAR
jgi:hypothetical protein